MAEILRRRLEGFLSPEVSARIVQPISEYFLATLAAQAAVLPLLFARSAQLSWATLPANILILPAQPLLMILGGLSVLAGLVWEIPAQALAWLAWAFAAYTIRIVEWFAGLPGPSLVGGPTAAGFLLVLFALMFSGWFIWPLSGLRTRLLTWLRPGVLIVGLAALSWVVWSDLGRMPDGYLHLYLLDVNTDSVSGDAVLIKTPDGQFVLLDGGPSVNRLSDALGRRLPLSNRRLDWLVVGGVEEGQLAALPSAILRYPPMQVLWAGGTHASPAGKRLHAALLDADIPRQFAESGQVLEFSEGGRLRVLAAGTRGAIFLLEYGNFRALLPLGPDADMLDELNPETIGRVDAWLLAGNGYAPLNPPSWLNKLTPSVILISVAVADYRSLPDPGLLNQFAGTTLLRTDEHGWVHLQTDGERLWVTVEK
jgi:competence protein ComEC